MGDNKKIKIKKISPKLAIANNRGHSTSTIDGPLAGTAAVIVGTRISDWSRCRIGATHTRTHADYDCTQIFATWSNNGGRETKQKLIFPFESIFLTQLQRWTPRGELKQVKEWNKSTQTNTLTWSARNQILFSHLACRLGGDHHRRFVISPPRAVLCHQRPLIGRERRKGRESSTVIFICVLYDCQPWCVYGNSFW